MAQFTQNITEKFGPERLPTGWPWRFFLFALIIFGISAVGYLGLTLGYEPFLNAQIRDVDQELSQLAQEVPQEQQEAFLKFYSQLANLQQLLSRHTIITKIFPLLEQNANQRVFYSRADISVPERKITLDGFAASYDALAQQLEAYNQMSEVQSYNISESQLSEGRVRFRASLILNPAIFK